MIWSALIYMGPCIPCGHFIHHFSYNIISGSDRKHTYNLPVWHFQIFWFSWQNIWKEIQTSSTFYIFILLCHNCTMWKMPSGWGRGNSTAIRVSVCQASGPGSRPAWSTCLKKVEFYHSVIDSFPPVPTTGSPKAVHVLSCLCNYACKRSLAICRKSRASCPVSTLLSVPIWPACAEHGH